MIIDFHTHIFPSFFRNDRNRYFHEEPGFDLLYRSPESEMAGKQDLIDNMDKEGVNCSVVFGFPWRKVDHYKRQGIHHFHHRKSALQNGKGIAPLQGLMN